MKLSLHPFRLKLRHPFGISRGVTTVQGTLIVELEQDGLCGYGEVTEARYYGVTVEGMAERLESIRPAIESASVDDPARFWHAMNEELGGNRPFELSALDAAAVDLWGKLRGQPVWKLWGLDLATCPPSDYTIGIDTVEKMVEKLNEFPGWPVYKIKLGTPNDLEIVRALREHTDAVFRVDANCAWTADETIRNAGRPGRTGRRIHRAAPPGRRNRRDAARVRGIGPAARRRRKLPRAVGRRRLRRPFPRNQHQTLQMRRPHPRQRNGSTTPTHAG